MESQPNTSDAARDETTSRSNYGTKESSSNLQQITKIVQVSQKQSSELEYISESIKKLQSSIDQLRERMETMEKGNAVVIGWVNRKIAKKEKKRKAKEDTRKKTKGGKVGKTRP
jgi:hypothetical protein